MSEPKFYRRKILPQRGNSPSEDIRIPSALLVESRRRRIELIQRENIVERFTDLPKWMRTRIRFKLFLTRLWIKIRKQ